MFRQILHSKVFNIIVTRNQSSKLIKFEEKLKPADKIKKLHYENKYLFGAKAKEPKVQKGGNGKKKVVPVVPVVAVDEDVITKQHEKSGEMFWLLQYKPVLDFEKPSKTKKVKTEKSKDKKSSKKSTKKVPDPESPDQNMYLPDDPRKHKDPWLGNIKSTMDISFQSKLIKLEKERNFFQIEREIPFNLQQLRQITSFPVSIGKQKVLDLFEPFEPSQSSYPLPSVSKVLQGTMSQVARSALIHWKTTKIAELGLEGFNLMQQSHLDRGKQFHGCLQNYFQGIYPKTEDTSKVSNIWHSIEPLLKDFEAPGVLIEDKLTHPYLYYKGIVDCVTLYQNSALCVIEWKKSDRLKKTLALTYDAPIQLCAYLGALNSRKEYHDKPITNGIVVVAYNDGSPANIFQLNENDLRKYWKVWVTRLQEYWIRYRDDTLPKETI